MIIPRRLALFATYNQTLTPSDLDAQSVYMPAFVTLARVKQFNIRQKKNIKAPLLCQSRQLRATVLQPTTRFLCLQKKNKNSHVYEKWYPSSRWLQPVLALQVQHTPWIFPHTQQSLGLAVPSLTFKAVTTVVPLPSSYCCCGINPQITTRRNDTPMFPRHISHGGCKEENTTTDRLQNRSYKNEAQKKSEDFSGRRENSQA
ncbi:hypothetical protein BX600DRAFT_296835 [Xylariales sp. PMI_506]|nr:hypothetical protein BX600DRAFT_296835 [Xylariales sp. PMI_506]